MRVVKGEKRDINETLKQTEEEVRNLEKQLEHKSNELKGLTQRFEKQKGTSDQYQEKYNKSEIQLKKATKILTDANKAIKHKDLMLEGKTKEISKLTEIL